MRPLPLVAALVALLVFSACERGDRSRADQAGKDDARPGSVETVHGGLRIGVVLAPSASAPLDTGAIREAAGGLRDLPDPEVSSVRTLEPPNARFRRDELILLAEEGHDLVCTVGAEGRDDLVELAALFPTTQFCLLGGELPPESPPNAFAVTWRAMEAGFLAGAAAALAEPDGAVGIIVGVYEPTLEQLRIGFEAGVRQVRPGAPVLIIPATDPRGEEDQRVARDVARLQYRGAPGGVRTLLPIGRQPTLLGVAQSAVSAHGTVLGWEVDVTRLLTAEQDEHVFVSVAKRYDVALLAAVRHVTAGGPSQLQLRVADAAFALRPGKDPRYPPLAPRLEQLAADLAAGRINLPG
ncbi:MAG: BMP family ABC transporter substrate-binding protein [Actinomycetota bacterium]|nr:BMP family ABC transporter substrate-binding protein [Actinomycetota bacterium]